MSTKFSQAKTIKLPATCHGSLILPDVPYGGGEPLQLSCLAEWVDVPGNLELHESFDLMADASLPGWSGSSSDEGDNLKVTVEKLLVPHEYDIVIILRDGQAEIDDASWHNVYIAQGPPFESDGNRHDYLWAASWDAVTLLD